MKKILSLVLALMLVLSMATTAFATTFEDLEEADANLQDAAELLSGLKIIEGFPDGEFKAENGVTRAQMAVMIIKARGLAAIATDTPSFTDSQTHWAKGFIALASDLGIIEGKGNGIFDPDGAVTYEQAATMMLRALGYTNESINGGASTAYNGANYRAKAIALNLFKDLSGFVVSEGANRGDIALMLNRNLSNSMVETNDRGRAEYVTDESGAKISLLAQIATKNSSLVVNATVIKNALTDISSYLYQNVVAYLVDGKVIFVEASNSKTVTGAISTSSAATVKVGTKTYNTSGAAVFFNGAVSEFDIASDYAMLVKASATLVYNDAETSIIGIVAEKQTSQVLVTAAYRKDSSVFNTILLPTKDSKVDLSKVTVIGAVDSIQDIEANDVVKAYAAKGSTIVKLLVVRDSIEGKVTTADNAGTTVFIDTLGKTVGSKVAFKVANENFNVEGTFYLDENGNVFAFAPKTAPAAATTYAMVTATADGILLNSGAIMFKNPTVTVVNAAGESTKYTIAEDAEYKLFNYNGTTSTTGQAYVPNAGNTEAELNAYIAIGSIVKSVVVEDGEVTQIVLQSLNPKTTVVNTKAITFNPASNVVVFNYNSTVTPAVKIVSSLENLVAMGSVAANNFKYIENAKGEFAVIIVTGENIVSTTPSYAIITGQKNVVNADGEAVQELEVYVNGEKVTYLTKKGLTALESGQDMVNLTISGGIVTNASTVTAPTPFVATSTGSAISSVLATRFQANGNWLFMDEDAAIYLVDSDGVFVRVGAMSDLEMLNANFYVYHTGNVVSSIVIVLD